MRIAVLGDLHIVSPDDPMDEIKQKRIHFTNAWPYFKKMIPLIREEAPDLVISLGDIVDWYSDENRDFALELIEQIKIPWMMTPGNHDFQMYKYDPAVDALTLRSADECYVKASFGWKERFIELGNRYIDAGNMRIFLLNSGISDFDKDICEWIGSNMNKNKECVLFTHSPRYTMSIKKVRDHLYSKDNHERYRPKILTPDNMLFKKCLNRFFKLIYNSHVHFQSEIMVMRTRVFFIGLSTYAYNKHYDDMGKVMILDIDKTIKERFIQAF